VTSEPAAPPSWLDVWSPTLLKRRRTKIAATLGPASSGAETVKRLIEAGVDLFRLNMAHGQHDAHAAAVRRVRAAAGDARVPIGIFADLAGPKLRVGQFVSHGIELVEGTSVVMTTRPILGERGLIPSQYSRLTDDVRPGSPVLLDDGLLELRVDRVEGTEVWCTVVQGGPLTDRKGLNLPRTEMSAPALSEKDRDDARFALDLGVDYLALSFVRYPKEVEELRALIGVECQVGIIAKIERPEALENIDDILDVSDGIMVARGDLGVELPPEQVPVAQRELVARARAKTKPSIVATQMLDSMISHPRPTRAEVSDVSTAVFSGADAVMLSGETATGRYPVQAVGMMDRIARQVEAHQWSERGFATEGRSVQAPVLLHEAIGRSTSQLSRDLKVRAIVVVSDGQATARIMSSSRPAAPIVAPTTSSRVMSQLTLLWGVVPLVVDAADFEAKDALARRLVTELGLAQAGQPILTVSGFGPGPGLDAPMITVLTV
jgi:pyruvate kinase